MGALQAAEMASLTDLDTALRWHLQSNHYPPIPLTMLAVCKKAIVACNEEDSERAIKLPKGVRWRGLKHAPAFAIVEGHHLGTFLCHD